MFKSIKTQKLKKKRISSNIGVKMLLLLLLLLFIIIIVIFIIIITIIIIIIIFIQSQTRLYCSRIKWLPSLIQRPQTIQEKT